MNDETLKERKLEGFPPVVGDKLHILILGSMPSVRSLELAQYYGFPRNHFWRIISTLLGQMEVPGSYEARLQMIKDHGIGLWDVIGTCYREGSLDVNIRHEEVNPIPELIRAHPELKCIVFNGTKAQQTFKKHIGEIEGVPTLLMPSTSPVPTQKMRSFKDRYAVWSELLEYLEYEE